MIDVEVMDIVDPRGGLMIEVIVSEAVDTVDLRGGRLTITIEVIDN